MKQWFNNLKIGSKLHVTVGTAIAGLAVLAAFSTRELSALHNQTTVVVRDWLPGVERIGALKNEITEFRQLHYSFIAAPNSASREKIASTLEAKRSGLAKRAKDYEETIILDTDRALFNDYTAQADSFLAAWAPIQAVAETGNLAKAEALMQGEMSQRYDALNTTLDKLIKLNHDESLAASAVGDQLYSSATISIIALSIVCALLGFAGAWYVGRSVSRTTNEILRQSRSLSSICMAGLRGGLDSMANGDTSVRLEAQTKFIGSTSTDELGEIARTVDDIITAAQSAIVSYTAMQEVIEALIVETRDLSAAAEKGELATRADASRYRGAYGELLSGMNGMLTAVATPIDEARTVLAQVADRDLTPRMRGTFLGDYDQLKTSINTAIENIADTLTQVQSAAEQVAAAGTQISSASQSLAQGSSEQAAGIEEISSSTTEFASMSKQNAANANEALALAESVRSNASEGQTRMNRLTEAVEDIQRASNETAKIVKTIEEIAFQTNLLALNAAVEAARAGDAGRGFAVVADEVRTLAIRSAEASKTTAELIERGLANSQRGVVLNAEVMGSLQQINAQVQQVTTVIAEIAASSVQQSDGVQQINVAVDQLNGTTQHVASNAEESASTAEELSSQAAMLQSTVGQFRLESGSSSRTAGRRSIAPARNASRSGSVRPSAPRTLAATASRSTSAGAAVIPFDGDDNDTLSVF